LPESKTSPYPSNSLDHCTWLLGDFVVLLDQQEPGSRIVVNILPRKNCLSRGVPGDGGGEQLITANIDTVFIVTSAGKDLNLRRLE
jgi:ribosome biogenesis GTPase / thiamine phosphate phosphatase